MLHFHRGYNNILFKNKTMKEIMPCKINCLHVDYTFYNHNNNINKTMKRLCEINCLHIDYTFYNHNNKINKTMKEICEMHIDYKTTINCLHIDRLHFL